MAVVHKECELSSHSILCFAAVEAINLQIRSNQNLILVLAV